MTVSIRGILPMRGGLSRTMPVPLQAPGAYRVRSAPPQRLWDKVPPAETYPRGVFRTEEEARSIVAYLTAVRGVEPAAK